MFQFRHCLLPLFAADIRNGLPQSPNHLRYLGVAYHFNDQGDIATCKHVVEALQENESLVGVEMHGQCLAYEVKKIRCHASFDFAVGKVERRDYEVLPIHGKREVFIGTDVLAYGFTNDGIVKNRVTTTARLFKGHVVRTFPAPVVEGSRSTLEVSFAALKGFSGTPLLLEKEACVVGMLFGNSESTIMLHSFSETDDNGDKYSEQIHRVIELGLAHSAADIRKFLVDLNIQRVAYDTPEPDPIET